MTLDLRMVMMLDRCNFYYMGKTYCIFSDMRAHLTDFYAMISDTSPARIDNMEELIDYIANNEAKYVSTEGEPELHKLYNLFIRTNKLKKILDK